MDADASSEVAVCNDHRFAADLARRALRVNPLDAYALALLGLTAERDGDSARADTLMRIAGARSWRDPVTQLWLFRQDLIGNNPTGALTHVDALWRTDPEWERIFSALAATFMADPQALQALIAFLGTDPPWRAGFLFQAAGGVPKIDGLLPLYRALQAGKTPPNTKELQPLLARLIRDSRFEEAYRIWQETLPPERRNNDHYLYNGDFAADPDGLPFDWVIRSVQGAVIKLVALPGGSKGRALQIEFAGSRVDFQNVTRLMILPSGHYRFSGRVKTDNLRTQRGLWWRVSCANIVQGTSADPKFATLGHTELVKGAVSWTGFDVDFEVPKGGCPAQWLTLELPARIGPEQQIEGVIWFESLRIFATTADARRHE